MMGGKVSMGKVSLGSHLYAVVTHLDLPILWSPSDLKLGSSGEPCCIQNDIIHLTSNGNNNNSKDNKRQEFCLDMT
jgi:hypothetical protein